jgi:hypothetical protein
MNFQRDITLVSPGGTKRSATVSCHARHWNEGSFSRRECTIQLRARKGSTFTARPMTSLKRSAGSETSFPSMISAHCVMALAVVCIPRECCAIWVQDWRHINCKWASQSVRKTSFISSKLTRRGSGNSCGAKGFLVSVVKAKDSTVVVPRHFLTIWPLATRECPPTCATL